MNQNIININKIKSFIMFNLFEYVYSFKFNKLLSRNFVCLTHALGSVGLNTIENKELYQVSNIWSTGYFMYDIIFTLRYEKLNPMRLFFLYHHIASTYIIHKDPKYYYGDKILFWSELSNIPSYFVYYYLHTKIINKNKVKLWLNIQKYLYSTIRIPVLGYYLANCLKLVSNKTPILSVIPIYLMGIIWTFKIYKQKIE